MARRGSGVMASAPPRHWLIEHAPFLLALVAGVVLRLVVRAAFVPGFIHSDGPTYLAVLGHLTPLQERPVGYTLLLLWPASLLTPDVTLVVVIQHLLGLLAAVVLYALLRRRGAGRAVGTIATLPVLLDSLQLNLEHTILTDVVFEFLVVCALAALCWRVRLTAGRALLSGSLLGLAVTVRLVGEPLVLLAVVGALLLGGPGPTRRVAVAVAVLMGAVVPAGAYVAWYHHDWGVYALSQDDGRPLYMRTTSFVDCSRISVPDYQRVLCPREPLEQRHDPTYYGYHDLRTLPRLRPPAGVSQEEAMRRFALASVRAQPADYARTVVRDLWLTLGPRTDQYEYHTASKWRFVTYLTKEPTDWTGPAYAAHGGRQLEVHEPYAELLAAYELVGFVPGLVLLGALVVAVLGGVRRGRGGPPGLRAVTWLFLLSAAGLVAIPDLTAEFVWRYQLPAVVLLPVAAALGWTSWRGVPKVAPRG